jgi:peptidoglycan/xylan/chitin deacetylase (PgdA/CDA1 family)
LKHRIVSLTAITTILFISIFFRNEAVLLIGVTTVLYLILTFYGSFQIKTNYYLHSINKGTTEGVTLSFDDGPDPEITPKILDILRKDQIKASFFVIGKKAEAHPELLASIASDGHIIANHSYEHDRAMGFWRTEKLAADIEKCSAIIKKVLGYKPTYFRPPFGVTNPRYSTVLKKLDLTSIGWSGRSFDTVITDRATLLKRVKKQINKGAILLFHDTQKVTLEILPDIIEYCNENGIKIVSLQELINKK